MSSLALLQELQTTLDLLRTIERDLAAFPPELAKADADAKALQAQADKARAALAAVEKPRAQLQTVYDQAKKIEKERAVTAAAKPLKELDAQLAVRQAEVDTVEPKLAEAKAKFEADHALFLAAHENQVIARTQLEAKQAELWAKVEAGAFAPRELIVEKLTLEKCATAYVELTKRFG